jgi:hypothetical protein
VTLPVNDVSQLADWATSVQELRTGSIGALHHQVVITPSPNLPLWPRIERQVLGIELRDTRALAPVYGFDTIIPEPEGAPFHVVAPPRARLVSPRGAATPLEATAGIHADPAAAIAHPYLIGDAPPPLEGRLGDVRWVGDEVETLTLDAVVEQPSVLALHDAIGPGWSAEVDGFQVPLVAVNLLSRGVMLPPGHHDVVFRYEVPGLQTGLSLCGLAAVLLLALVGWEQRRLTAARATADAPDENR